jgi:hypothetical protein
MVPGGCQLVCGVLTLGAQLHLYPASELVASWTKQACHHPVDNTLGGTTAIPVGPCVLALGGLPREPLAQSDVGWQGAVGGVQAGLVGHPGLTLQESPVSYPAVGCALRQQP